VIVSSGTLLAAAGFGSAAVTAGALFYLVVSTFTIGAFFLLAELVERGRVAGADMLAVTLDAYGGAEDAEVESSDEVGIMIPATMAVLGIAFAVCAMLFAGLPPLSGFVAKFAMLAGMIGLDPGTAMPTATWVL